MNLQYLLRTSLLGIKASPEEVYEDFDIKKLQAKEKDVD